MESPIQPSSLLPSFSPLQTSGLLSLLLILYLFALAIYRVTLHPLSHYPGPRLAALTQCYEFYHDYFRRGRYEWEVHAMHAQYGPVVRISPRELHIQDPDYYDTLLGQRLDKDPVVAGQFGNTFSMLSTATTELHRTRRGALAPFFSQAKVATFQSVIVEKVDKLSGLLAAHQSNGTVANMYNYYRSMTTDIITSYAFVKSWDLLNQDDAGQKFFEQVRNGGETSALIRMFPWLQPAMESVPVWLIGAMVPDVKALLDIQETIRTEIVAIKEARTDAANQEKEHPKLFGELIYKSSLSAAEKGTERLTAEGGLIVIAGSETTGNALNVLHFHLLANPDKMKMLKAELAEEIKDRWDVPTWQQLRKLPFLSACISEALRLSAGVPHRLARMAPKGGLQYRDWIIPEGTPISMSSFQTHMDAKIFPQPHEFVPERWLAQEAKGLSKYLSPFSKGPRICLGIELAYAELYLTTAIIHRRFDTELYGTTREDIDLAHDFFLAYPRLDSKGLQVKVSA